VVIRIRELIPDHFFIFPLLRNWDFWTFVSISHTINNRFVPYLAKWLTPTRWCMHPQHFGTDPTDIRIWINPKIRFRIPDHFRLKFWRRRRFALSCCCCYCMALHLTLFNTGCLPVVSNSNRLWLAHVLSQCCRTANVKVDQTVILRPQFRRIVTAPYKYSYLLTSYLLTSFDISVPIQSQSLCQSSKFLHHCVASFSTSETCQ